MELSQARLFALLLHSAIGGAFIGAFGDLLRAARMAVRALLTPITEEFPRPKEKRALIYVLDENNCKKVLPRIGCQIFTLVADVIFMIASALMIIIIAYACNSGRMRWMLIAGHIAGFVFYRITVGKLIMRVCAFAVLSSRNLILKICIN